MEKVSVKIAFLAIALIFNSPILANDGSDGATLPSEKAAIEKKRIRPSSCFSIIKQVGSDNPLNKTTLRDPNQPIAGPVRLLQKISAAIPNVEYAEVLSRGGQSIILKISFRDGSLKVLKLPLKYDDERVETAYITEVEMYKKIKDVDPEAVEFIAEPLKLVNIPDLGKGLLMEYEKWMDLERQLHRYVLDPKKNVRENALLNLKTWRQMAIAIRGLHRSGYIHRDIKPANFLIAEDKNKQFKTKLTDFGIATTETQSLEKMAGTLSHMSKDRVKGELSTKQHDLYSLRVTFVEMLMGESIWKWKVRDRDVILYETFGEVDAIPLSAIGTKTLEKGGTYPVLVGIPKEIRENAHKSVLKILNLGYRNITIEEYIRVIDEEIKKLESSINK